MKALKIENWPRALQLVKEFGDSWVFRGQANSAWKLQTTLERAADTARIETAAVSEAELKMLAEFMPSAQLILGRLPDEQEWIDWLSLMQHHGAPTRLLDITRSFYVAAFFAATEAQGEFSVWAIRRWSLDEYGHGLFSDRSLDEEFPPDSVVASYRLGEHVLRAANEALKNPNKDVHWGVALLDPRHVHERLQVQQGGFLCPLTLDSFGAALVRTLRLPEGHLDRVEGVHEAELDSIDPQDELILRVDFSRELRLEILKDLWKMNIRAATLFPGVDGLSRSMRHYIDTASFDPVSARRAFRRVFRIV